MTANGKADTKPLTLREEMVKAINDGYGVHVGRTIVTRVADLPADEVLAGDDLERLEAAKVVLEEELSDIQARIKSTDEHIAALKKAASAK